MKAINFLDTVWSRDINASAYAILTNDEDGIITCATFGEDATPGYGEIPVGKIAAVYMADRDGADLASALYKEYRNSPDALVFADNKAIGIYKLV